MTDKSRSVLLFRYDALLKSLKKNAFLWFIFIILVIVSLHLKFSEIVPGLQDEFVGSDPEAYHRNAVNVLTKGDYITSWHNPLEAIYLVGVYSIFGIDHLAARYIQIIFSFLIPYFLFFFTKKFYGKTAGLVAAGLSLIEPNIIYYSAHLWDMFWVIFLSALILFIYSKYYDDKNKLWPSFFIGLFSAIGALGKLWLLPAGIVLLVFFLMENKKLKDILKIDFLKSTLLPTIFFIIGICLIIIPWNIYASNSVDYSVFINRNSNLNFYLGNNPNKDIPMKSVYDWSYSYETNITEGNCGLLLNNTEDKFYPKYLDNCLGKYTKNYLVHNPVWLFEKFWKFNFEYWLFPNLDWYQRQIRNPGFLMFAGWFLFLFSWLGFFVSLDRFWKMVPFYLIQAGIWLSYFITVYLARYKASIVPLSIFFSAIGIVFVLKFVTALFKDEDAEKKE